MSVSSKILGLALGAALMVSASSAFADSCTREGSRHEGEKCPTAAETQAAVKLACETLPGDIKDHNLTSIFKYGEFGKKIKQTCDYSDEKWTDVLEANTKEANEDETCPTLVWGLAHGKYKEFFHHNANLGMSMRARCMPHLR